MVFHFTACKFCSPLLFGFPLCDIMISIFHIFHNVEFFLRRRKPGEDMNCNYNLFLSLLLSFLIIMDSTALKPTYWWIQCPFIYNYWRVENTVKIFILLGTPDFKNCECSEPANLHLQTKRNGYPYFVRLKQYSTQSLLNICDFRLVLGWVSNEMECNKINFTIYANSVMFRISFFNFYLIPSISSAYTLILHVYPMRIRMDQMKWKCLCLARCSMTLVSLAGFKL